MSDIIELDINERITVTGSDGGTYEIEVTSFFCDVSYGYIFARVYFEKEHAGRWNAHPFGDAKFINWLNDKLAELDPKSVATFPLEFKFGSAMMQNADSVYIEIEETRIPV